MSDKRKGYSTAGGTPKVTKGAPSPTKAFARPQKAPAFLKKKK